jgi:hypothetical protein
MLPVMCGKYELIPPFSEYLPSKPAHLCIRLGMRFTFARAVAFLSPLRISRFFLSLRTVGTFIFNNHLFIGSGTNFIRLLIRYRFYEALI